MLQIPVNEKKGLTFARGLRSILRHDPDKIMVGEIRDAETAQIAVQAALTGHQVFTTVHANNVFDVIGRFANMGVDSYSLVAALNGIVAQRLLRMGCTNCAAECEVTPEELRRSGLGALDTAGATFKRGLGCAQCRGTGYRGRRAIAEMLAMTDILRDQLVQRAPLSQIRQSARENGFTSPRVTRRLRWHGPDIRRWRRSTVLLPWSRSVRLLVTPVAVQATLERGWPKRAEVSSTTCIGNAFDPLRSHGLAASAQFDERASLIEQALLSLEEASSLRLARLDVLLDNALVHVDVAEGEFAQMGEHQLKTVAQACVSELLGDEAEHRDVRWNLQPDERHLAICAVDRSLVPLFRKAAKLHGMTLASVQSQFGSCWNVLARSESATEVVFVVASRGSAIVACVLQRSICALSTGPWLNHRHIRNTVEGADARYVTQPSATRAGSTRQPGRPLACRPRRRPGQRRSLHCRPCGSRRRIAVGSLVGRRDGGGARRGSDMNLPQLDFDFASNRRPADRIGAAIFVTVLLVFAWQELHLAGALRDRQLEEEALASFTTPKSAGRSASARADKPDLAVAAKMQAAGLVAYSLATPWADLLGSLEEVPPLAVALISVEPSVSKQSLRLTVEARDTKEMLAYLSALQKDAPAYFGASHLTSGANPGAGLTHAISGSGRLGAGSMKRQIRLNWRRGTRRLGAFGMAGLLLVVPMIAVLAWTQQLSKQLAELHAAVDTRAAQLNRLKSETPRPAPTSAEQLRAFVSTFPPLENSTSDLERIFVAAEAHAIPLPRGEYQLRADPKTALLTYTATFAVRGSYSAIKGFAADILHDLGHASLEELRLSRDNADSTTLDAMIRFHLIYRSG